MAFGLDPKDWNVLVGTTAPVTLIEVGLNRYVVFLFPTLSALKVMGGTSGIVGDARTDGVRDKNEDKLQLFCEKVREGVDATRLDEVMESDNPKAALVELLLEHHRQRR